MSPKDQALSVAVAASLLALALTIVATCCSGCHPATLAPAVSHPKAPSALERSLRVSVECNGEHSSGGSAVDIGDGFAITARHITLTRESCVYTLFTPEGTPIKAAFLMEAAEEDDIALLQTALVTPSVAFRAPVLGLHIWTIGYPAQLDSSGQALTVTDGVVARVPGGASRVRITAPIYFGNSGGPCWDDTGALVGVTVSLYAAEVPNEPWPVPMDGQYWVVSSERVQLFLRVKPEDPTTGTAQPTSNRI